MDLNITIDTDKNCKVVLLDNTEYLPESYSGTLEGRFKYSDTVSIAVLLHNKIQEPIIKNPTFGDHSSPYLSIPVEFDGWFTVNYIVLPNKEWFYREKNKTSGSALGLYTIVYFSDGERIYKYIDENIKEATINEVLLINPFNTTISKTNKECVSICFLLKCYINLCQLIFNERGFSPCWNKNTINSELVYKRDLVWMAINIIKYLTDLNLLSEVERIIELITSCNGLCTNSLTYKPNNNSSCGCSK